MRGDSYVEKKVHKLFWLCLADVNPTSTFLTFCAFICSCDTNDLLQQLCVYIWIHYTALLFVLLLILYLHRRSSDEMGGKKGFWKVSELNPKHVFFTPPFVWLILPSHVEYHNKCIFYGVLMCSQGVNPPKYLYAHTNWIRFLNRGLYTTYCMHSLYFKVNHTLSRTYWTWLAGTITMRCPYNGRAHLPDLPIYLAVLMSAY